MVYGIRTLGFDRIAGSNPEQRRNAALAQRREAP